MPGTSANTGTPELLLTLEGIKKLEEELNTLKTVKRQEVAERIKVAISFGDISENAEYDEAKNDQAFVEGRIITLESMLRSAKVVAEEDVSTDLVNVGVFVKVLDVEFNEEIDYAIVGSAEADPLQGKISNESPLGRALVGHAEGDEVTMQAPDGIMKMKILKIFK